MTASDSLRCVFDFVNTRCVLRSDDLNEFIDLMQVHSLAVQVELLASLETLVR